MSERRRLLAERQVKIDAEGLHGKVPTNATVSTWYNDRGSRASSASSGRGSLQVSSLYDAAEQARIKRFAIERERIAKRLSGSLSSIESDYVSGRTQTERNARRSAQGNEEKLAALGLNMGSRYDAATSGAAETSRIAVDNQYRGDLNALEQARLGARAAAQAAADDQQAALTGAYYTSESDAALSRAQAALQQYNADRDYSLSAAGLTGYLNGTPTLAYREYQTDQLTAEETARAKAGTQAYEQAFDRWKTRGYVSQADASILGVPAGTPTADTSYKNASLALQRWKAGYWY